MQDMFAQVTIVSKFQSISSMIANIKIIAYGYTISFIIPNIKSIAYDAQFQKRHHERVKIPRLL